MRFNFQQITFWYGTEDAPAPQDDSVVPRQGVSMVVAVQPPHPAIVVTVVYRVDGGLATSVRGVRQSIDVARQIAYFRVDFPTFWTGSRVTYVPTVSYAGRTVPDAGTVRARPSAFRLDAAAPWLCAADPTPRAAGRLPYTMEYLASIRVPLKEPETIGVTPGGIRVNWFWSPGEGVVSGSRIRGKVRQVGGDWMTIRQDGVGLMDVRATIETEDGALLYVSYQGHYELGPTGYQDFLDHRWPARAPTRTTPTFHTAHPDYVWLNRLVCVGIGEVRMQELAYAYDLYALR